MKKQILLGKSLSSFLTNLPISHFFFCSFLVSMILFAKISVAQSLKLEIEEKNDEDKPEEYEEERNPRKHIFEYDSKKDRIYYFDSNNKNREKKQRKPQRWYHHIDDFYDDIPFFHHGKKPTVTISVGSQGTIYRSPNAPIQFNSIDASIGYVKESFGFDRMSITEYDHKYLYLSNLNNVDASLSFKPIVGVQSSMWRIGFGERDGYGYRNGSIALTPYHGSSLVWSNFNFTSISSIPVTQQNLLSDFNNSTHFGQTTEAGARLTVVDAIALDVTFQRSLIYRRVVFWQWVASYGIEQASLSLLDGFLLEIRKSSPQFAPVMGFLLKNGLSYGLYQLRREKMNYPFESEAPLSFDLFKVGINLSF